MNSQRCIYVILGILSVAHTFPSIGKEPPGADRQDMDCSVSDSIMFRDSIMREARYLKTVMRYDDAIALYACLLEDGRFDAEIISEIADCNYLDGNYSGARTFYVMLNAAEPDNLRIKVRLMQLDYKEKRYGECIRHGHAVLRMDSIPAVCAMLGDAFNSVRHLDSARLYYHKALSLRPLYPSVIERLADILLSEGKCDEVIAMADSFLAEVPGNVQVGSIKGIALYINGEYRESLDIFSRLSKSGDESYKTHWMLGQNFRKLDRIFEAETELLKAYKIDSSHVELVLQIASVKAERLAVEAGFTTLDSGAVAEMSEWFDKALDMMSHDADVINRIWQSYGYAYYRLAQWDDARKCYETALGYGADDTRIFAYLGYCSQMSGALQDAFEYYSRGMRQTGQQDTTLCRYFQQRIVDVRQELFMSDMDIL